MNLKNKCRKKHFLLLEVLIALAIIVMCILPLIYPHIAMLQAEKKFVKKIELDHVVTLLYANINEQLYKNEIPLSQIESKSIIPIPQEKLVELNQNRPLPYLGSYQLLEEKHKPKKKGPLTAYFVTLQFSFLPIEFSKTSNFEERAKHTLRYEYKIFITQNLKGTSSLKT